MKTVINSWILLGFLTSCGAEFLDVKSDSSIASPSTIADYQAILDNGASLMNGSQCYLLNIVGSDDYTLSTEVWQNLPASALIQKKAYYWSDDVVDDEIVEDWNRGFSRILHCNIVLEGLQKMSSSERESSEWNTAKGSALFFRAYNFYQLAQTFCPVYEQGSASMEKGLPLRLESDVSKKVPRSNLAETYRQIIRDLEESLPLLPDMGLIKMRPSKAAALSLLARMYLLMFDYPKAGTYAQQALAIHGELMDYRALPASAQYPFARDYGETNTEVIFFAAAPTITVLHQNRMDVSEELLALYSPDDLRRTIFYSQGSQGNIFFRGSYFGFTVPFVGITTAELYLMLAESLARSGKAGDAIDLIRMLWTYRARTESIPDYLIQVDDAVRLVLEERRRELAFRGLRWEDLRRLNKEGQYQKVVSRQIGTELYQLEPNSPKYVWPIPWDAIRLGGIEPNDR